MTKDETPGSAPPLPGFGGAVWGGLEVCEGLLEGFLWVEGVQVQISDPKAKFYISGIAAGAKADLRSPVVTAVCTWPSMI